MSIQSVKIEKQSDSQLSSFLVAAQAGVRKAAESLRIMSDSAIRMEVISAGISPTSRLSEVAGNPEDLVVGIYISATGDMTGHALLVFPYESALHLVDMLTNQTLGTSKHMDEMERSVMQEIGNIVVSSYLNALSDFFGKTVLPSCPSVAIDMAAAVVDSVLLNTGHFDDDTISIVTRFAGCKRVIRGFFMYIPEINIS
jgi:chemotaxis protein CheC